MIRLKKIGRIDLSKCKCGEDDEEVPEDEDPPTDPPQNP